MMEINKVISEKERLRRLILSGMQEFVDETGVNVTQIQIVRHDEQTIHKTLTMYDVKVIVEI